MYKGFRRVLGALTVLLLGVFPSISPFQDWVQPAHASSEEIDRYFTFDGTDDVATGGFNLTSNTDFSIEMWLYFDGAADGSYGIFRYGDTSDSHKRRVFAYVERDADGNNELKVGINGNGSHYATGYYLPGQEWVHFAIVREDSSNWRVDINGTEVFRQANSYWNIGGNPVPFRIGDQHPTGDHWKGRIDQVKIWDGALTSSEVQTSMTTWDDTGITGKSLLHHYDFNDISTTQVTDQQGTDHLSWSGSPAAGSFGDVKTATSSGLNTVVEFPRSYLTSTGGWTVPAGISAIDYLLVGGGGSGGSTSVGSAGGGGGGRVSEASSVSVTASTTVAVTVGSGGIPLQISGQTVARGSDGGSTSLSGTGLSVAALGGSAGANAWLYNPAPQATASTAGFTGGGGSSHAGTGSNGSTGVGGAAYKGGSAWADCCVANPQAGGGGGGAGGAGANATSGNAGAGGTGVSSSISGTATYYGGGGGGGKRTTSGAAGSGGQGGGGAGGKAAAGNAGGANTGGGGGGAGGDAAYLGGFGGSGIVIIRFALHPLIWIDASSDTGASTVLDASPNNYDATLQNSLAVTSGVFDFNNGTIQSDLTTGKHIKLQDTIPDTIDFSAGISVHVYADFGTTAETWERLIDFGSGNPQDNILFSRVGTTNDLTFQVYNGGSGASSPSCTASGVITSGMKLYSAVLDGTHCQIYIDGVAQIAGDGASFAVLPVSANRTLNYIGQTNWTQSGTQDKYLDGSIGSVRVFNSVQLPRSLQDALTISSSDLVAGATATLSSSGGSGDGEVSYTVESGNCTISGTTLTSTGSAGDICVIRGIKAATSTYFASTDVISIVTSPAEGEEILRFDATHPDSFTNGDSLWTDLQLGVTASRTASISFDETTKSFSGFGTSQQFTVGNIAKSFADGISVFAVVDFAEDDRYWERIIDFGTGQAQNNIIFSRYATEENLVIRTYAATGGSYWECRTTTGDAIEDGFHQYGVSLDEDGTCTFYRDGSIIAGPSDNVSKTAGSPILPTVTLTSNFIGQTNWSAYKDGGADDEYFSGSVQSVVVYNTAVAQPTCSPIESTFTGDGTTGESGVPYRALVFSTGGACQWSVPTGVTVVDALLVAGGGGGGAHVGGGGGAGGVVSVDQGTVSAGSSINVHVGLGGAGGNLYEGCSANPTGALNTGSENSGAVNYCNDPAKQRRARSGQDSTLGSFTVAIGGGGGAAWDYFDPQAGGSGGGSGHSGDSPGSGTSTQGFAGGAAYSVGGLSGGGGGGAGAAGGAAGSLAGGAGGAGAEISIVPASTISSSNIGEEDDGDFYVAGGGGGGFHGTPTQASSGGLGGGGNGNSTEYSTAQPGLANSGSGGGATGGANNYAGGQIAGAGGSGVVILRYSTSPGSATISSVSSGDGSIDVAFTAPSHTGGAAVSDYEYSFDGSTWTSFGTASAGTETISGLTNGTAYTVRVRAVNANGNGVSVTAGSATTPRGAQTLSWSPSNTSVDVTDGSVALAPAASALGGVTIEYSVQTAGTPSCAIADNSTPTVTFSAVGTCVIRATAVAGGAYQSATTDVTLTVSKASQTITFASVSAKTYGDSAFSLTVSSTSGLTVTVTPADTSVCTVASTTVTIVSVGTCSLTASQSGNGSYDAATDVTRTFTISPKAITMAVAIADKTYDGSSAASVSGTPTLTGLVAGDSGYVAVDTGEITAAFANPDAGSAKAVTVTLGDDVLITGGSGDRSDRYTVTVSNSPTAAISKASQSSLSITSASSMVFGQSIPIVAVGGSSSGALSYSKVSGPCTVSGSSATSTGAGSCVVTATRAADTNYNAVTSSNFTITISKANQSVNFTSTVPVSAVSGTTYTPTATATSGLTVAFDIAAPGKDSVCSISGSTVTFLSSGTCVIEATQAGDSDYNAATKVTQTIVAGKINQTITFPSIAGKDFDDPAFASGATVSSGRTVTFATSTGSVCAVDASTGVVSIKTVGDCTVTASSAGDASYAAASDVSRTFTISPVLAGKPSVTSVSFGDSSVTVAFLAPGFVGGDAIDGYQVVATSSGGSVTKPDCSTTSPCTITGLTNGDAYTLTVAAINAAGVGPASAASPSITPARVADAVSGLATTPGDEELEVTWTALTTSQLGGGTFTRYDVYLRVNGGSWGSPVTPDGTNALATRTTTSYTFTGLTNGTAYDVKIVAITSVNSTALSSNTATALGVPATVPDAPTGLVVSSLSNTTAFASWTAPADDGGDSISAYSVNLSCTFVNATDTFCTLSGLTAGARVTVSVGATNLMGTGSTVSYVITMPGGSSGSSSSSSSSRTAPTVTPTVTTPSAPILPNNRILPRPAVPTRPPILAAPVPTSPGLVTPSTPLRVLIDGRPVTTTTTQQGNSGVSVKAGALEIGVGVKVPSPTSSVRTNPITAAPELVVAAGETATLNAKGMLPESTVQVWLPGANGRELARIPVAADGSISGDVPLTITRGEAPIPVGRQVLQVTGFDEAGNQTVIDTVINIAQGAPAPERLRETDEVPDLQPGQTLATSAGAPETVRISANAETRQVSIESDEWTFTVTVPEANGSVNETAPGAPTVQFLQASTAVVDGEGFQPDTRVDIFLFSDPTLLGSFTVAEDGSVSAEIYLDKRFATIGDHTLQIQGVGNDGYVKAANLGVLVEEPPMETTAHTALTFVWWIIAGVILAAVLLVVLVSRRRQLG